ncbi:MAG: hypothetical protein ACFFG0_37410 [Candidatus Thorarchaeota archaeon]
MNSKKKTIHLEQSTHKKLKIIAGRNGEFMEKIVDDILRKELKKREKENEEKGIN